MSLPTHPTYLLRALKGAPLACLFALLLCEHPASQVWLMQATGYSPNSVSSAMRLLEELGLAGRSGPLGDWSPLGDKSPQGDMLARSSLSAELAAVLGLDHSDSAGSATQPSKFEASPGGGEEESDSSIKNNPPPPLAKAQNEALPTGQVSPERILGATRDLFGEMVHGPPSRYRDARLLLATIAEVYSQRHTLSKPARVVYTRLKTRITPAPAYLDDPCAHLPPSFLLAAGLPGSRPELTGLPPPDQITMDDSDLQPDGKQDNLPPHPSLSLLTGLDNQITIAQAWQKVRETLRSELPEHVFDRRVEGLVLQSFDPQTGELTLATADSESAAWLSARLAKRLSQVLSGVCARPVEVKVVVS